MPTEKSPDKLDRTVAQARRASDEREKGYRAKALKMYPWICGRCMREFTRENLQELTVHHRDHDHDNNPSDGSNWELLCVYCHDHEHTRGIQEQRSTETGGDREDTPGLAHSPFAALGEKFRNSK